MRKLAVFLFLGGSGAKSSVLKEIMTEEGMMFGRLFFKNGGPKTTAKFWSYGMEP